MSQNGMVMSEYPSKETEAWISEVEKNLKRNLVDSKLQDQDGHLLAIGQAAFDSQSNRGTFWTASPQPMDALQEKAARLETKDGRQYMLENVKTHPSTNPHLDFGYKVSG